MYLLVSRVLIAAALLVALAVAQNEPWRQSGTVYADRNPVILVPGFGGTVMVGQEHGDNKWVRSWFPLSYTPFPGLYTSRFERFMKGTYVQEEGYYRQHCYKNNNANPNGEYFKAGIPYPRPDGLYAVNDILPNVWIPFVSSDKYYEETIKTFKKAGYVPGVTLYGFPYDWRQSSFYQISHQLNDRIEYIVERTGKSVDVVSHSNGCLVTRAAMYHHGLDEAGKIRRWVAQGGPWQGATKTYAVSAVGDVGIPFIGKEARDALIQAPGFYDLLPNPLWDWQQPPEMRYSLSSQSFSVDSDADNWSKWTEILNNHQFDLPDNPSGCGSSTKTLSPHDGLKEESDAAWELIKDWKMSSKVEFYNIIGNIPGETTRGVDFSREGSVSSMPQLKDADFSWIQGDGDNTVPLESLDNPTHANSYTRYLYPGMDHSEMLRNRRLVSTVVHLISRPSTTEVFLTGGAAVLVVVGSAGGAYAYRRRSAQSAGASDVAGAKFIPAKTGGSHGSRGSKGSKRVVPGTAAGGSRGSKRGGSSHGSRTSRGSRKAAGSAGSKRGSKGSRGSNREGGAPADIHI